ncbi:unnamed protein product [Arabis nemorensis]|uniref:ABC-2 type transporter transmembrane domain-containing protein n=1 Tax=Arabis nemorensis TaxID=586526 RepID=A0A565BAB9_9BRAS|nr:unnamed protein product [Arabis nemorensis]
MMTVSVTPNQKVAAVFAGAFYELLNRFSGFLIPRPKIPKWYYWICPDCPVAWTIYGLIVSQYGDMEDTSDDKMVTLKTIMGREIMKEIYEKLVQFSITFRAK